MEVKVKRLLIALLPTVSFSLSLSLSAPDAQAAPPPVEWRFTEPSDIVLSSPAIASDGTVYIGSHDNSLYAIDPVDGTKNWEFVTGDEVFSSPAIGINGTIYVGSDDGSLYAINASGTQQWEFTDPGNKIRSSPAIDNDGNIYITADDGNLYAVHANGTLDWSEPVGSSSVPSSFLCSSPVVDDDGTIYVAGWNFSPDDPKLFSISTSGRGPVINWTYEFPTPDVDNTIESSPSIGPDGTIYIGTDDSRGRFYAINPDGTLKWVYDGPTDRVKSTAIIGPDHSIYFGSDDDNFYALNPDGTEKWTPFTEAVEDICASAALASDGTLYVPVWEGINGGKVVYGLDADTGTKLWEFTDSGNLQGIYSSPAIAPDGTVYFGCINNTVYALGGTAGLENAPWSSFRRGARNRGNAAKQYTITDLGTLGGNYSKGFSVNESSTVVGMAEEEFTDYGGVSLAQRGYYWENGTMWALGTVQYQDENNYALDVTDDNISNMLIAGYREWNNDELGFRWTQSSGIVALGSLNGNTVAEGVNDSEEIVGTSVNSQGTPRAVFWSSGSQTPQELGSLASSDGPSKSSHALAANKDSVVGKSITDNGVNHAYLALLQAGEIDPTDDLGALGSSPDDNVSAGLDVNDLDEVVGYSEVESGDIHAFLYTSSGMQDLGTLGGTYAAGKGNNNVGEVVGESKDSGGTYKAFIYREGWSDMKELNTLLPPPSGSQIQWDLRDADDVNDKGEIVGWGYNPDNIPRAFLMKPDY